MSIAPVHVVGGGLAGSEAAWQIAQAGVPVILHEMRGVPENAGTERSLKVKVSVRVAPTVAFGAGVALTRRA